MKRRISLCVGTLLVSLCDSFLKFGSDFELTLYQHQERDFAVTVEKALRNGKLALD